MRHRLSMATMAAALLIAAPLTTASVAAAPLASESLSSLHATDGARDDVFATFAGRELSVPAPGVLANDGSRAATVVRHSTAGHGDGDVAPDGSLRYRPAPGFHGMDTLTYTTTDAVQLFRTHLPPLATVGSVPITAGGYGSSLAPVPGVADQYFGLTDRGPNFDGPHGEKVEPLPNFAPSIGRFRFTRGKATLLQRIPLRLPDGTAYSGRRNSDADTGETIVDLDGRELGPDKTGYDPEGLVAMRDGSFWVSDEYGPFITHFDRSGRQLSRLSPYDATLPTELRARVPNRGMEGLTVTPDGNTLVGIMQSGLQQPDTDVDGKKIAMTRIVTYSLRDGATHEFLFPLADPITNQTSISEITPVSNDEFLVDVRDGKFAPHAFKKFYRIDLRGATDVGPRSSDYDPQRGKLIGHLSIEAFLGTADTATATAKLGAHHIKPVQTTVALDFAKLISDLDPTGSFFGHDKIEGVATRDGGRTLIVSNDSDFGIDAVENPTPPYALHAKILPNGRQDDGEYLAVDTNNLPARLHTATVHIWVL